MVTLSLLAGAEIGFDENSERIRYDQNHISCDQIRDVRLQDINPVLLNKSLRYPEYVYSHHDRLVPNAEKDNWPKNCGFDLIAIPVGLLGIEYVKTHVFYADEHGGRVASVIQVFNGSVTVLMQKNKPKKDMFDIDTHVDQMYLVKVKTGEKLAIPAGYMYTFINTSNLPVVFSRVVGTEHVLDYTKIKRENGLAYYVIAKNARTEMVANPRYRTLVPVKKISAVDLNDVCEYKPDSEKELYDEVCTRTADFNSLWR